jgi:hypothetical protein
MGQPRAPGRSAVGRTGDLRLAASRGARRGHRRRATAAALGFVWFAASVGLSIAALYEIYEYVAVTWLDAGLAIGYTDTSNDLILGAIGAQGGGVLLMIWAYKEAKQLVARSLGHD